MAKLTNFVGLQNDDVEMLHKLCRSPRTFRTDETLIEEDSNPGCVQIVLSGLAYRYKLHPGGHRQILGYLVPGDFFDLSFMVRDRADHSIATLVDSQIARIPLRNFENALLGHPNLIRALHASDYLDLVVLREWLLNAGQPNALQKLSHFLCEMCSRLSKVGEIGSDGSFYFPFNQAMLGDTFGLTTVHINRTLQRLRSEKLIVLNRRRLKILDVGRLAAIGNFNDNYLKSFDLSS